jgi:AAA+ superfamily predicted ATPase
MSELYEKVLGQATLREFFDGLLGRLRESETDLGEKAVAQHLGCESRQQFSSLEYVAPHKIPVYGVGVEEVLQSYRVTQILNTTNAGTSYTAAEYTDVVVDVEKKRSILTEGICLAYDGETPLVVEVDLDQEEYGCRHVKVTVHESHKEHATGFLARLTDWVKNHNFLRGKMLVAYRNGIVEIAEREHLTWEDVILPTWVKEEIADNTTLLLRNRQAFAQLGVPLKRGILLCGAPGSGKTLLGRVLASITDCTFLMVSPKAVATSSDIAALYDVAKDLKPAIIFFEDVDLFGRDRAEGADSILGELLNQLDGLLPLDDVITIGSTNFVEFLDKALGERPSRFDRKIELPYPDDECRRVMLRKFSSREDIDFTDIVRETRGLNGAYIKEVVVTASIFAVKEVEGNGTTPALRPDHFRRAVEKIRLHRKRIGFDRES